MQTIIDAAADDEEDAENDDDGGNDNDSFDPIFVLQAFWTNRPISQSIQSRHDIPFRCAESRDNLPGSSGSSNPTEFRLLAAYCMQSSTFFCHP